MKIPSKRQKLFKNFQDILFYKEEKYTKKEREYAFYLLLRPMLSFLEPQLKEKLEQDEIESEFFILSIEVFRGYNKEKSSIVPYLEKYLPWYIAAFIRRVSNTEKEPIEMCYPEEEYHINKDFYWKNILLEDQYVGKCFTRGEKYIINIIINSDKTELSVSSLAKQVGIRRWRMNDILSEIKEVFKLEEIDARRY